MISRSILPIDDLMKPSASAKSSESCLSEPSSTGSAVSVALSGADGAADCARAKRRDPLEDVAAQFLELAGEAHDVHQRRAQVVADDIGEALDLVIGFAQIRGALVDRGLEVDIVVAQPVLRRLSRARDERRTRKIATCRPARSRGPSPATVTAEASCWVRSAVAVRIANSRSSSARIALRRPRRSF